MPNEAQTIAVLTRDPTSIDSVVESLQRAGYRTVVTDELSHAPPEDQPSPDLVLIDRRHHAVTTLLGSVESGMLLVSFWPKSSSCTEEQYIEDLEAGVDDVLTNQTPRQIVTKVRALLRRRREQEAVRSHILSVGGLRMDLDRHEVTVQGKVVTLTPKEFAILRCFLAAPGRVFTREDMLNRVWGEGYALEEHALDVHVHALRHKIEKSPAHPSLIVTVRGLGYKLKA